ncbi:MAG TPA: PrsW family glutamic-type intramembrane protease [Vicinamibacterales bacterium]|nr:PrsW family glutamic-type intramembrane protease [Vicinamibacterales bacterium]
MLEVVVALLPVSALLIVLILFDSFKLVPPNTLIRAALAGVAAALIAWLLHLWLFDVTGLDRRQFARYVAPVTEELLKAAFVLFALRRAQIGFLVDAAIIGFTIGAGFAVVENVHYLGTFADRPLLIWIVRGFGTAILHATTTAIVAIAAKSLADRYPDREYLVIWPGLVAAIVLHSVFNHALVSPLLAAGVLTLVLPLVVLVVFGESERRTREWVGDGLDLDVELLALVKSSQFGATRLGRYLQELKSRFPGPVVADMFCLLQLDLELAIRAKGMLMAREAGLEVPADPDLKARLDERAYLHKTIGPTGRLALRPLQVTSDRDDWHRYLLGQIRD